MCDELMRNDDVSATLFNLRSTKYCSNRIFVGFDVKLKKRADHRRLYVRHEIDIYFTELIL